MNNTHGLRGVGKLKPGRGDKEENTKLDPWRSRNSTGETWSRDPCRLTGEGAAS